MTNTATLEVARDEQAIFVMEDALCDALCVPADAMTLYRENITLVFIDAEFNEKQRKIEGAEKYAYRVMEKVYGFIMEHGQAPQPEVVREWFPEIPFGEPTQPVAYTIRRLRERRAHGTLMEVQKKIARFAGEDVIQAVNWGFSQFSEMRREVTSRNTTTDPFADYVDSEAEYMQAKAEGKIMGYTFGFGPTVDEALGGIRGLTINMGRPKQLKSWIQLWSSMMAAMQGASVVFYSLEMALKGTQGMTERLECLAADYIARQAGVKPGKGGTIPGTSYNARVKGWWEPEDFRQNKLFLGEWERLMQGSFRMDQPPLAQRTVSHLRDMAAGADVAYIDQFKYIKPNANVPTRIDQWQQIEYICESLVEWADVTALCVTHQFNREATKQRDEESKVRIMGDLEHIAGGDAIGRHAHLVVGSLRTKAMKDTDTVAFGDVAVRSAEGGEWWLGYDFHKGCRITYEGLKTE